MAAAPPTYNPLLGPPPKSTAPSTPEPTPAPAAPAPAEEKKSWKSLDLPNPGVWEFLQNEAKAVMAVNHVIDGARVSVTRPVSNSFQVTHNIEMGSNPSYRFNAVYVGTPADGNPEMASPLLMGDVDGNGNFVGSIAYNITPALKAKFDHRYFGGKREQSSLEMDYKGKDFNVNVKAIDPNIVAESGTWTASYFQSITKRIALGGEFTYQYEDGLQQGMPSIGGRYKSDKCTFAGTLSPMGYSLSYTHRVDDKITLATELETDMQTGKPVATVGYLFDLRQNAVRGSIDSNGVIAGVLENKLGPGLTFNLTGMMDHVSGKSKFGMGFILG